jgi:biotin transport system substrate-specific component
MTIVSHPFHAEKTLVSSQIDWRTLFQVLGASGLMALCSQIKINLPFTPVPLTCQTLAVMLIGASLGSRKGAWALLLYFVEILMGLPVLSGGTSDPMVFLGPKGGYVLGFCLQAFLMGWFVETMRWSKSISLLMGGLFACAAQMGLGILMLAQFVGWNHVWTMGFFPFIPGEILKVFLVCFGLKRLLDKNP